MRHVLGPRIDPFSVKRAAVNSPADSADGVVADEPVSIKIDPVPAFRGLDFESEPVRFTFDLEPYQLDTHNRLARVTVIVTPTGHGEPVGPDEWLASSYPKGQAECAELPAGEPVLVDVPGVGDGVYFAQVVYSYDL